MSTIQLSSILLNNDPINYVADQALVQAVEIAIALGKPLVVSGEPGTGKTQLAHFVASQLHQQTKNDFFPFAEKTLVYNTKSGSSASDLFYHYDAVGHFRNKEDKPASHFIELKALGLAICMAHGKQHPALKGISSLRQFDTFDEQPKSSVVLIDEIDKAPRDFPNDLLNEMENYEFDIRELNQSIRKPSGDARIVVIMTSNSEKNLPNAFLRRCVFYHIPFPDKEKLMTITRKRMAIGNNYYDRILNEAIDKFIEYRQQSINKKPATSEFLDWMNILKEFNLLHSNGSFGNYGSVPEQRKYESSLNVLFKNKEDIDRIINKTV